MPNVGSFDSQHTPLTCGKTNQTRGLIILGDMEEITCSDTILKMKHPTQNQLAMGGEA